MESNDEVAQNHGYFPVFVTEEFPLTRDELYLKLQENYIYGRRYFYPLISEFKPYDALPSSEPKNLKVAHQKANEVVCLPLYAALEIDDVKYIGSIIRNI